MTIREQVAADIDKLWMRVATLIDDQEISPRLRSDLRGVAAKMAACISILQPADDSGPTAADIAGEVVHVPAPF